MSCKGCLTFWTVSFAALFAHIAAAPPKGALVKFYPISRAQYNDILGLTDGKPVVSEARLISNGFPSLSELRTAITNDINTGWQQLVSATGQMLSGRPRQEKVEGYPLCVIKTVDLEEADDDVHDDSFEYVEHKGRGAQKATVGDARRRAATAAAKIDGSLTGDNYEQSGRQHVGASNTNRPVINCVVVMKSQHEANDGNDNSHEHGQNQKKRRAQNQRHNFGLPHSYRTKNNPAYADYVDAKTDSILTSIKESRIPVNAHKKAIEKEQANTRDNSDDSYEYLSQYHRQPPPYGAYPFNAYPGYFNPYAHGYGAPYGYGPQLAYPTFGYPHPDYRDSSEEEAYKD